MSKAEVQTFTVLAVVTGAIKTIAIEGISGNAAPTIMYLEKAAQEAINRWPELGSPKKNTLRAATHCRNLHKDLDSAADKFTACCLGMMAQYLLISLRDKLINKLKLGLVDELLESVNGAVDIYDPEERMVGDREEAERLCRLVLNEIGW